MPEFEFVRFIIVVIITVFLVIMGFILVLRLKKLSLEKHLMKNDLYQELLNEQREAVKVVCSDLAVLKEKVNSIEKLLKEVE